MASGDGGISFLDAHYFTLHSPSKTLFLSNMAQSYILWPSHSTPFKISAAHNLLSSYSSRHYNLQDFSCAAPLHWNSLLQNISHCPTLIVYKPPKPIYINTTSSLVTLPPFTVSSLSPTVSVTVVSVFCICFLYIAFMH